ncbi:uncharacterized protein LOC117189299 isoform X1 [Drosophila miranda]|uniref:uncharacterized protein LOC117189299 isoform X1 n=1 Tax=Drosophila miranda TaxID=7229 RepID=UPI00143F9832|nr:uncharacterized protein LOC117189299 isoform X1 [Drosophila miranda]
MDEASGTTTTDGKSLDEAPVAAGLEPTQPIGFLQLFRFSTCGEIAWLFFGFLMCCVKALTLPAVVIIYSEFTAVSTGHRYSRRCRFRYSNHNLSPFDSRFRSPLRCHEHHHAVVSLHDGQQQRRRVHHSHGDPEHPSHRGERPAADHHDNGQWLRAQ